MRTEARHPFSSIFIGIKRAELLGVDFMHALKSRSVVYLRVSQFGARPEALFGTVRNVVRFSDGRLVTLVPEAGCFLKWDVATIWIPSTPGLQGGVLMQWRSNSEERWSRPTAPVELIEIHVQDRFGSTP
jgi:hypothetical protein